MNIMKAGKKPVVELTLADLALDAAAVAPRRAVRSNLAEEQSRKHVLFDGDPAAQADALVNALVAEGVLASEGDDCDPRLFGTGRHGSRAGERRPRVRPGSSTSR